MRRKLLPKIAATQANTDSLFVARYCMAFLSLIQVVDDDDAMNRMELISADDGRNSCARLRGDRSRPGKH